MGGMSLSMVDLETVDDIDEALRYLSLVQHETEESPGKHLPMLYWNVAHVWRNNER